VIKHKVNRSDIDFAQLSTELSAVFGRSVGVQLTAPADQSGELIVVDNVSGAWLDVDPAAVASAITAHVALPEPKTPHKALADTLGTATNIADLRAALQAFAGAVVTQEVKTKQLRGNRPGR
jgi:hypothetical protein